MKTAFPKILATISTGLLAGSFLYGILNLVPTFYEVPLDVHLSFRTQLMNHNSVTMQLLMVTSIVMPVWFALVNKHTRWVLLISLLSATFALTALVVTRFGNVPINQMIKSWSASSLPANWRDLLHSWDLYNLIRSTAAVSSFIAFISATHLAVLKKKG